MSYWFLDGGGGWRHLINYMQENDTIVASTKNITTFFKEITSYHTINLRARPSLYENSLFSVPKNIYYAKKDYDKYFSSIKNETIYVQCKYTAITFFSYIKKLRKNNTIIFVKKNDNNFNEKEYYGLHWIPMKLIGYILGVDVGIKKLLNRPLWYLKEKTLGDYTSLTFKQKEPNITLPPKFMAMLENKDTLVLLNDLETLAYSPRYHSDKIAQLLNKKTTIVKNHTRNPKIYGVFNDFRQFPSYVPAEILITNHKFKNIVTLYISKTSLHKSDARKICAYNMIDWKIPVTEQWIQDVTKHNTHLPKDEKEFRRLLQ